jgi:hypothetical protein
MGLEENTSSQTSSSSAATAESKGGGGFASGEEVSSRSEADSMPKRSSQYHVFMDLRSFCI